MTKIEAYPEESAPEHLQHLREIRGYFKNWVALQEYLIHAGIMTPKCRKKCVVVNRCISWLITHIENNFPVNPEL